MAKEHLEVVLAAPGPEAALAAVDRLIKGKGGIVTAFNEARLPPIRQRLPEDGRIDVLPFGSVVRACLANADQPVRGLPQRRLAEAAIAQACSELEPESPFFASRRFAGLHRRLVETGELLRNWGVDEKRLAEIAEKCSEPARAKLRSLASIFREAGAILEDLGLAYNSENVLSCLDTELPETAERRDLVVLAGSDYAPLHARWLKWISSQGVRTTVVVERSLGSAHLFAEGAMLVEDLGVEPVLPGTENPLLESLFSPGTPKEPQIEVAVMSASDPLAEVEWALRGFARLRREGLEWNQMALFARDLETYGPLIHSASLSLGVPVVLRRRSPILSNGFARLLLQVLKFLASGDVRTIGPILRSSYVGLPKARVEEIRAAARDAYADRGNQWQRFAEWAKLHKEDVPWLVPLLEWRERATAGPLPLDLWLERVHRLPAEQPWLDRPLAERDGRIFAALRRALVGHASVQRVRGNPPLTLPQFVALAEAHWSEADCSLPSNTDGVGVHSQTEGLDRAEALHVLGMLEGVFPQRRSEDPILTDAERAEISRHLGGRPLPDSHLQARRERDHFYRLCAAAGRSLVCSYPLTDEDRDNVPAFYLEELARVAGKRLKRIDHERTEWAPPLEECLCERDRRMAEALEADRDPIVEEALASDEARALAARRPDEAYSPRQLRDAYECPFRFFAHHRLNLRAPGRRDFWSHLIQLPRAAGLPLIDTKEKALETMRLALEAEIESLAPEMPDWQVRVIRAGGERLIHEWVEREFAKREHWSLPGAVVERSVEFGDKNTRRVLKTSTGESVPIRGSLPALTRQEKANIGHIYRRSHFQTKAAPGGEIDGSGLELGAYLGAIFERGKAAALDVETMNDRRLLYVTEFDDPCSKFPEASGAGLEVKLLGPPNAFFEQVMAGLSRAMETIARAKTNASPGEHCARCDLGELCRRSREFGEEESPFDE